MSLGSLLRCDSGRTLTLENELRSLDTNVRRRVFRLCSIYVVKEVLHPVGEIPC